MVKYQEFHVQKLEDVELLLPKRMQMEPKPGDNPRRRPYPKHAKDLKTLRQLMSLLTQERSQQEYSRRDARIEIQPYGVLLFHALDLKKLVLSKYNFDLKSPFCVYLELECQGIVKCSDPVYSIDFNKVRIDHSVHMGVELSDFRDDSRNEFFVHIYAFQDPSFQYLVGSQKLHLYDFVREIHGISSTHIVNERFFEVGNLVYEFAWAYGSFGYGFSQQLENLNADVYENVCHSMFPRIRPAPSDLIDNKLNCRTPKNLRLVTLHNLLLRLAHPDYVDGGGSRDRADFEAKSLIFRHAKFVRGTPVHVLLELDIHQKFMESDFNNSYGEFVCLRNRKDRLTWLTHLTDGRLGDRVEHEASELFKIYDDAWEPRRILSVKRPLGCPPGFLEATDPYKEKDVHPIHPDDVTDDDVKFAGQHLGCAPRYSGWLAYAFGYEKPPPVDKYITENFTRKLESKADLEAGQKFEEKASWSRKIFLLFAALFTFSAKILNSIWLFIFPTFKIGKEDVRIPELSLTKPSPQHSTTDFHSFCTQRQIPYKESDLAKVRRRVEYYVEQSRMSRKPEIDPKDFEDMLVPPSVYVQKMKLPPGQPSLPSVSLGEGDSNPTLLRVPDVRGLQGQKSHETQKSSSNRSKKSKKAPVKEYLNKSFEEEASDWTDIEEMEPEPLKILQGAKSEKVKIQPKALSTSKMEGAKSQKMEKKPKKKGEKT